ncbi:MAG: 3-hydroxyacyl-CoA dehydrogenase NAD-binding domain-containing protein [Paracoccaceae bacterium]|nr:3-hydroxyacyl-CoA dehydrogenase NAD-binding domain-containing protein [Paracoccaceae bacterium]
MTEFKYSIDSDGVAIISWDVPNKTMNVMSLEGLNELDKHFDSALSDDKVKGIVVTSGKRDFAGGMDLNVLADMKTTQGENPALGLFNGIMQIHKLLRKIELAGMNPKTKKGAKPVAAAITGTAAGIGLELPLACHRIFAIDNEKSKIGLPEILVGIFPGAGGTTRLVRKLGAMNAAPFLLEGKMLSPSKMKLAGIIDELTDKNDLLSRAKAWVLNATDADCIKPWDDKSYKMPGGEPYHPNGYMTFAGASVMVNSKTQGAFPAAKALLSAVYEGAQVPFETALKIEARWFTKILMNPSSESMIRSLFINKEALEKGAVRPKDIPNQKVEKIGIIGAGMMGAGISYVSALAGIKVVLLDMKEEDAQKGKSHAENLLNIGVKRKKIDEKKKSVVLDLITPTTKFEDLKDCDLIVEAVFEDPAVKAEVTKKVEAIIDKNCIFASNTSTLPITSLASASKRPEQFIGIHFFSPVDRMLLVEIIKGSVTGDMAVAKALDYVRQIKKTPIVVNDARFFYANRCIIPYVNEGAMMVSEGITPASIENAAKQLGFPLGPLQLTDETSIDLGVKIIKATRAAMGNEYPEKNGDEVSFKLFEEGRLGRKTNAGFYDYDEKGKRTYLWNGLNETWPVKKHQPKFEEIKNRLMLSQVLEAVKAFEEGVLEDIREGDVGAILGWGFAPWSGGPFGWVDMVGIQNVVNMCNTLSVSEGQRFAAPQILLDMAKNNETFYGKFIKNKNAA